MFFIVILGLIWLALMKKKIPWLFGLLKDIITKYEERTTHVRDKLYIRGGGGGGL